MTNFSSQFLDDMTDRERSIFLYRFILKLPKDKIAQRLNYSRAEVRECCNYIKISHELLRLRADILEAFGDVNGDVNGVSDLL